MSALGQAGLAGTLEHLGLGPDDQGMATRHCRSARRAVLRKRELRLPPCGRSAASWLPLILLQFLLISIHLVYMMRPSPQTPSYAHVLEAFQNATLRHDRLYPNILLLESLGNQKGRR